LEYLRHAPSPYIPSKYSLQFLRHQRVESGSRDRDNFLFHIDSNCLDKEIEGRRDELADDELYEEHVETKSRITDKTALH